MMSKTTDDVDRTISEPVSIRPVSTNDAAGIVGVLNPIIEARVYTALDTPFSITEERDFIDRFPARGLFHVAVLDKTDRVVGFQTVEPFADYTHAFDHVGVIGTYVDLNRRRQHIASQLFATTLATAPKQGYGKLFAFVRADNRPALFTYLRHGFRVIGNARRHARVGDRYVDEILIEKLL